MKYTMEEWLTVPPVTLCECGHRAAEHTPGGPAFPTQSCCVQIVYDKLKLGGYCQCDEFTVPVEAVLAHLQEIEVELR